MPSVFSFQEMQVQVQVQVQKEDLLTKPGKQIQRQ